MLRHSVDNAAYEAARSVIVPGATAAEAEQAARAIMDVVWARGVDVEVDPSVIQNSTPEVDRDRLRARRWQRTDCPPVLSRQVVRRSVPSETGRYR